MTPDTLVFDIETQNFFTDPDVGRDNFEALKISAVGIYSYSKDEYVCFEEGEMEKAAGLFRGAGKLVGFSSNRYDVPVLNLYFQKLSAELRVNLWEKERVDLLERIEAVHGKRVSLSRLAEANLGRAKTRHSSEAVALYREGKMDELKTYCLEDVRITKELYDLYLSQRFLLVPDRETGESVKVEFGAAQLEPQKPTTAKLF